jgi:hypothetical protein
MTAVAVADWPAVPEDEEPEADPALAPPAVVVAVVAPVPVPTLVRVAAVAPVPVPTLV